MIGLVQRRSFVSACLAGALLVSQLAACTSWRVASTSPAQFTAGSTELVRVVRRNGATLTLQGTRVSGDTLYGTSKRYGVADSAVVIPLSDIRTIAVREGSAGKTIGLVAGITVAAAGTAVLVIVVTCAMCSN